MNIPYILDADLLSRGVKVYLPIDLNTHPHILCVGATGTGKTYALTLLMGKIAKYESSVRLVICDYKKSGFGWLDGCGGFYGYTAVLDGLDAVYAEFSVRLEANDDTRNAHKIVLLIDEYGALVSSLEKKAADEVKRKVGNILLMGRSLGIHLVVGIQRADAEYFRAGARDQFGAILMLGNLSKEQKAMLAPDYREQMIATNDNRLRQMIRGRLLHSNPPGGVSEA